LPIQNHAGTASTVSTLSIVIPIYNERDRWRELLERVLAVPLPGWKKQIVLVDDCSSDGTTDQLRELQSRPSPDGVELSLVYHPVNRGKGAALRTGFAVATGDLVIVQDADLEYDPCDYPPLLQTFQDQAVQVVYGSRFLRRHRGGYLSNRIANRVLTGLSNLATGQRLTDMETCYKVFRRGVLERIRLEQDRFGFEPEVTAKVSALGVKIHEVPISYQPRTRSEGKKIGFKDGLQTLHCILKYCRGRNGSGGLR
jgi:glycosyltransferase involved in cell wall biosynthesis